MHHHPITERSVGIRLWASLCLNGAIACTELIAGLLSGSIALLADAVHNLGDTGALALSVFARALGSRPPSFRYTYGLKRFEVLAAFLNAVMLAVIAIFIVKQAQSRLLHPEPIRTGIIVVVATIAFVANCTSALLLRRHDRHDSNVRTAFLHLVQDAISSLIVLLAAVLANTTVGRYLDPVAGIVIGIAVLAGVFPIIRETLSTLLEGAPDDIEISALVESVRQRFHPVRMHHVHVWQVGPGQRALTAHLAVQNITVSQAEALCSAIRLYLMESWRIQHVTFEPETKGCGSEAMLGAWVPICGERD